MMILSTVGFRENKKQVGHEYTIAYNVRSYVKISCMMRRPEASKTILGLKLQ